MTIDVEYEFYKEHNYQMELLGETYDSVPLLEKAYPDEYFKLLGDYCFRKVTAGEWVKIDDSTYLDAVDYDLDTVEEPLDFTGCRGEGDR